MRSRRRLAAGLAVATALNLFPGHSAARVRYCLGRRVTIIGTREADTFRVLGTDRRDVIDARGGNDVVFAGKGNDFVCGRRGNDVIVGGDQRDRVNGGDGDDNCDAESTRHCEGGAATAST